MIAFTDAPSPNFDARRGPPDILVLHYTGMETAEAAVERLRDREAKVSAHYVVDEDGSILRLVPEERRAWHAGRGAWQGETDVNAASIGIEIVNPGHEFGYRPFPEVQIRAVIALAADIRTRWSIPDARIIAHSDLRPSASRTPANSSRGSGWPRPGTACGSNRRRSASAPWARLCRRATRGWASSSCARVCIVWVMGCSRAAPMTRRPA